MENPNDSVNDSKYVVLRARYTLIPQNTLHPFGVVPALIDVGEGGSVGEPVAPRGRASWGMNNSGGGSLHRFAAARAKRGQSV